MSTEQQARLDMAARVRDRRVHLGLSLVTVAEHAGIDPAVLDDVEHGRVDPSDDVVRRLALFHAVPADVLLHGDPAVPEPVRAIACGGKLTEGDREKLVLFGLGLRRRARLGNPPPQHPQHSRRNHPEYSPKQIRRPREEW